MITFKNFLENLNPESEPTDHFNFLMKNLKVYLNDLFDNYEIDRYENAIDSITNRFYAFKKMSEPVLILNHADNLEVLFKKDVEIKGRKIEKGTKVLLTISYGENTMIIQIFDGGVLEFSSRIKYLNERTALQRIENYFELPSTSELNIYKDSFCNYSTKTSLRNSLAIVFSSIQKMAPKHKYDKNDPFYQSIVDNINQLDVKTFVDGFCKFVDDKYEESNKPSSLYSYVLHFLESVIGRELAGEL